MPNGGIKQCLVSEKSKMLILVGHAHASKWISYDDVPIEGLAERFDYPSLYIFENGQQRILDSSQASEYTDDSFIIF